jgi:CO/xanthine dehydrogenase FAD-binding subunit
LWHLPRPILTVSTNLTKGEKIMLQYDWGDWLNFMKRTHRVIIPHEIELPEGPDNDTSRSIILRNANLDELSTAVVALDKEIERMTSIKVALGEVQKRARNRVRPGSMTVHEALLGHAPDNE